MADTQVSVYNLALAHLGERSLVAVTDATEPARALENIWDHAVTYCLEQGHWKFAERESVLEPSVTEVPTYGLSNAFAKPSDYVRLNSMCSDEYFTQPIINIHERGLFWYCDLDELYLRYVSNDDAYGADVTLWPETFVLYVSLYLATAIAPRVSPDKKIETIKSPEGIGLGTAKRNALAKDAVAGPVQFIPTGSWVNSRGKGAAGRNSRNSIYGT